MPSDSDLTSTQKPAIVFNDVRKSFKINHTHSIKESLIATLKRKELSTSFNAVDGLSLEVPEGQSVAIMGRNGSGKSTTLKLLSGVLHPDDGWVRTRGRVAGLLEVGAGFHPDLSGRQNVYLNAAILGMSKEETDERFDSIVEFSEIGKFIDAEVKRYSSGMYARLGFAVAVHTKVDILLVDEVLSVGDASFRQKCDKRMLEMREQGKTMFIVSHSASHVKRLCERGIVLENGRIIFDGPIDDAVQHLNTGSDGFDLNIGGYRVAGGIRRIYEKDAGRYGAPTQNERRVSQNGGGWAQEFENGIITYSKELQAGFGITGQDFLDSYIESGGPEGPWGFIADTPQFQVETGSRLLVFQNGIVASSASGEISYEPHVDDRS